MRKHFERETMEYQHRARNLDIWQREFADRVEAILPLLAELSAEAARIGEEAVTLSQLTRYPEIAAEPLLDLLDQMSEVQMILDVWENDVEYLLHGTQPETDTVWN